MSEECLGNGASGGNVIYYMKLLHELKANYPSVPDEIVKESVIKFRGDKDRCSRDLSVIAGSIRPKRHALEEGKFGGPYRALLTHQMEQYLKLGQELGIERSKLNCLREEISRIEERRNKRRLIKLNAQIKLNEGLEKDIKSLRFSCDTLAAKVTKITKGKIPLGETNIELYARLGPSKNAESNNKNPSSGSSSPFVMRECKEPFNNLSHFIKALDEDKAAASKALLPPPSSSSSSRCSRPLEQWACTECTFLNHPALNDCEECEMPRFSSGLSSQEEDGSSRAFIHP